MSGVKTAVRTLRLYEAFAASKRALTLQELAKQLGMPVSSCFALVRTLLERGYLYETARRNGYYPTRRMLEYNSEISLHDRLLERASPHLERLRDRTCETVVLSKRQGVRVIYLAVLESPQIIRCTVPAGTLRPVHSTATGKALLSVLGDAERDRILDDAGMPRLTPRTVTSRSVLEAELAASRARGWFDNEGESVSDLRAVALPVQIGNDDFAVTIMGPMPRMTQNLNALVKALRSACADMQDSL